MAEPPSIIPIFPLPNFVLFPGVVAPLHIFEPRYREMIADVSSSHGRHVPRRTHPRLIVAETGIDDDPLTLRFDHQSMNTQTHTPAGFGEVRLQPGLALYVLWRRIGQHESAFGDGFHLDNTADSYVTEVPSIHVCAT